MGSLQARLMATSAIALGTFLALTGWVLERSFAASVLAGAEEQMRGAIYGLLAAAQERDGRLEFPAELGDPRLSAPESGWYAYLQTAEGAVAWRSPSLLVTPIALPSAMRPSPGSFRFRGAELAGGGDVYQLGYTVIWEDAVDAEMTFWLLADARPFRAEIRSFRGSVAAGLAGATLLLALAQLAALRWGLLPVRRMTQRIGALRAGQREDIGADYPRELAGLALTLNRFVSGERESRERHRRAMGNLAHSLKTPLTVLKNAVRRLSPAERALFAEQLERMETTVAHQLSRAVVAPSILPRQPVHLLPLIERLLRTLDKAYADKPVAVEVRGADAAARGDERDLLEMLGNLLENAYKFCVSRVRVAVEDGNPVRVHVEDDGLGVPAGERERVLARGARADDAHAGHGIGLAMVVELATACGGGLTLDDSDLGGARATLALPR